MKQNTNQKTPDSLLLFFSEIKAPLLHENTVFLFSSTENVFMEGEIEAIHFKRLINKYS